MTTIKLLNKRFLYCYSPKFIIEFLNIKFDKIDKNINEFVNEKTSTIEPFNDSLFINFSLKHLNRKDLCNIQKFLETCHGSFMHKYEFDTEVWFPLVNFEKGKYTQIHNFRLKDGKYIDRISKSGMVHYQLLIIDNENNTLCRLNYAYNNNLLLYGNFKDFIIKYLNIR